jgi:hypothetical protein
MKKKLVLIVIIALFVCVGLSGCNSLNAEEKKFVGTWIYSYPSNMGSNYTFIYHFFSDGMYSFNSSGTQVDGTFRVKDNKLIFKYYFDGDEHSVVCSYLFSENNTKVTINDTTYTRQ